MRIAPNGQLSTQSVQPINITPENFFPGDILRRQNADASVRAIPFAHPTGGALVLAVFILNHFQPSTETGIHAESVPIFRILFGHNPLGLKKIFQGDGKPFEKTGGLENAFKIAVHLIIHPKEMKTAPRTRRIRFTGKRNFHSRLISWSTRGRTNVQRSIM